MIPDEVENKLIPFILSKIAEQTKEINFWIENYQPEEELNLKEVQTSLNAYISMLKMARYLLAGEIVDDDNLRFWADE